MNHITVEETSVQTQATELQALAIQAADALVELNAAQMMLVGGGQAVIVLE